MLLSTAVNAVFAAKPLISGILFSNSVSCFFNKISQIRIFLKNSVLSVWYLVFETNELVSILFTFAANLSCTVF